MNVAQCVHPASELKGGGNQYSKDIHCALCLGRWTYLSPEELKKKQIEAKAYPLSTVRASTTLGTTSYMLAAFCRRLSPPDKLKMVVEHNHTHCRLWKSVC